MTISGSGMNLNFNPTPTIFEKQTTGMVDLKNTGQVRGNVVAVPASDTELVPFTKLGDRNKWDYKSEAKNPTLMPNIMLRGGGPDIRNLDEGARAQYETLYNQLSDDVKLELAGLPTVYTAALKFILDLAANTLDWQAKASLASQTENALNRANDNQRMADVAYHVSLKLGKELASITEKYVRDIGPNDPNYLEAMDIINNIKTFLKETTHDR